MNILPVNSNNQKQHTFGIKGVRFNISEQLLDKIFPEIERKRVTGLEHIKPTLGDDIFVNADLLGGKGDNKITFLFSEAQNNLPNKPKEELTLHSALGQFNSREYETALRNLVRKISHYRKSSDLTH